MKKQLIKSALILIGIFLVVALCVEYFLERNIIGTDAENELVLLNEIEQLTTDGEGYNPAQEEIGALQERLQKETALAQQSSIRKVSAIYVCFILFCLIAGFFYIYYKVLRPFSKLEKYAEQVAKGNFDFSLEYERENFFGAFTWAFDHMRKEIVRARENEAQAVSENKTIIATLSHDIKTPIASIRAYAEGLEAGLDSDYEQRERYLKVIMKKCDEVSGLVNDLVLHSLSELEKLEIKEQKISMKKVLEETIQDLEYPHISLEQPVPDAEFIADEKRMSQVLLNILENAKKYAPDAEVRVWALNTKERYEIHIRDYGDGILPEDMPFVLQKFYRGKNVGDKPGSGLGLYIVNYIMERMGGGIELENHRDGLEVVVWIMQKADNRSYLPENSNEIGG
ncbi:MAG: HAMP domain-containing histidine kinase [Lachnospiraceae bacterium]|nr:HAMP domain-containing histidine kinase [Lachnospiraceae bacterium]